MPIPSLPMPPVARPTQTGSVSWGKTSDPLEEERFSLQKKKEQRLQAEQQHQFMLDNRQMILTFRGLLREQQAAHDTVGAKITLEKMGQFETRLKDLGNKELFEAIIGQSPEKSEYDKRDEAYRLNNPKPILREGASQLERFYWMRDMDRWKTGHTNFTLGKQVAKPKSLYVDGDWAAIVHDDGRVDSFPLEMANTVLKVPKGVSISEVVAGGGSYTRTAGIETISSDGVHKQLVAVMKKTNVVTGEIGFERRVIGSAGVFRKPSGGVAKDKPLRMAPENVRNTLALLQNPNEAKKHPIAKNLLNEFKAIRDSNPGASSEKLLGAFSRAIERRFPGYHVGIVGKGELEGGHLWSWSGPHVVGADGSPFEFTIVPYTKEIRIPTADAGKKDVPVQDTFIPIWLDTADGRFHPYQRDGSLVQAGSMDDLLAWARNISPSTIRREREDREAERKKLLMERREKRLREIVQALMGGGNAKKLEETEPPTFFDMGQGQGQGGNDGRFQF